MCEWSATAAPILGLNTSSGSHGHKARPAGRARLRNFVDRDADHRLTEAAAYLGDDVGAVKERRSLNNGPGAQGGVEVLSDDGRGDGVVVAKPNHLDSLLITGGDPWQRFEHLRLAANLRQSQALAGSAGTAPSMSSARNAYPKRLSVCCK